MPALDNARDTSLGTNSFAEIVSTVGAVSKDLTRIIGQRIRASPAVIDIGRGNGNLFDQCGIGISANMGLEAVNCGFTPVFDPARIAVFLTCGGNDGRINQCAGFDRMNGKRCWCPFGILTETSA